MFRDLFRSVLFSPSLLLMNWLAQYVAAILNFSMKYFRGKCSHVLLHKGQYGFDSP